MAISRNETRIEDLAYDALFTAGFYLYCWDVEWAHRHGIPRNPFVPWWISSQGPTAASRAKS